MSRKLFLLSGGLSFISYLFDKMWQAFLFRIIKMIFMAKIQIVSQPFSIICMSAFRDIFLNQHGIELRPNFRRNLKHNTLIKLY